MGEDYWGSFIVLVDDTEYAYKDAWFGGASDNTPSGSATITIELKAGQIVRILNKGSTDVLGTAPAGFLYSWFTGYLLYAL